MHWCYPRYQLERRSAIVSHAAHELAHTFGTTLMLQRRNAGLPNHAMAEITYRNLELAGPPVFPEAAKAFAREIQKTLGLAPMDDPFMPEISQSVVCVRSPCQWLALPARTAYQQVSCFQ